MRECARPGEWVQVEDVLLPVGERSTAIPEETQRQPLIWRVKGFAQTAASMGESLEVETVSGRRVTGRLVAVLPRYAHHFGDPIPELLSVGVEARRLLSEVKDGA